MTLYIHYGFIIPNISQTVTLSYTFAALFHTNLLTIVNLTMILYKSQRHYMSQSDVISHLKLYILFSVSNKCYSHAFLVRRWDILILDNI